MKHLLFTAATLFCISSMAGMSAVRDNKETYEIARDRQFNTTRSIESIFSWGSSAESLKKPMKETDFTVIPDVGSYSDLEREFQYVRDTRFLASRDPNFPRRMTWLFPDDGCYARAQLAGMKLKEHNFPAPKKVFVFGNLRAKTNNTQSGSVSWWYHVAVSYRVGAQVYILDPAIEPSRPLKLEEWNQAVGGEKSFVKYSVCEMDTFDPGSHCSDPVAATDREALQEQAVFFDQEWNRLVRLKRNPEQELGENPPWLKH